MSEPGQCLPETCVEWKKSGDMWFGYHRFRPDEDWRYQVGEEDDGRAFFAGRDGVRQHLPDLDTAKRAIEVYERHHTVEAWPGINGWVVFKLSDQARERLVGLATQNGFTSLLAYIKHRLEDDVLDAGANTGTDTAAGVVHD